METVGVVGTVGDDLARGDARDQTAGWRHIVLLAGSDSEADRQAERIYDDMEFGAEATS